MIKNLNVKAVKAERNPANLFAKIAEAHPA
jgi:hypothetical protein